MFVSDKKKREQNKSILPCCDSTSSTAASTVASFISKIIPHKQQQQQKQKQQPRSQSQSQQPSNARRKKRLRSVRFSRSGMGIRTLSRSEYTPHEIKACWYQKYEYYRIQLECLYDAAYFGSLRQAQHLQRKGIECTPNHSISTAVMPSNNDNGDDNDNEDEDEDESINNNINHRHCLRGLESYCDYDPLAFKRRHALHNLAYDTVLGAQQENGNKSKTTADTDKANIMIASLYTNVSASCHLWANVIGMRDQREAELCYDDDDDDDADNHDDDDDYSAVNDNDAANSFSEEEEELLVRSDRNDDVEHELLNIYKRQQILLMG